MVNRLKDMGAGAAWRLLVDAALKGAAKKGYTMQRQPGRGMSNVYDATKDGKTWITSVRTTQDRWIAFPPLDGGTRWKTLEKAELVLVSAVDNPEDPQNVEVYLFPADEVRKRFNAAYAARTKAGQEPTDNFGMWIKLDAGNPKNTAEVGAGLANEYPPIETFSIDELEGSESEVPEDDLSPAEEELTAPALTTVAEVLTYAREMIARLTGMPPDTIKLDLRMGV